MRHCFLLIFFCFCLSNSSLFIHSAQASEQDTSKAIESGILQKLGNDFDLYSWEVVDVQETAKGAATIEKSILKITAVAKETLYQPAGINEKQQYMLRISKASGDSVEMQGIAIQVNIPGLPAQPSIQVVLTSGSNYGKPISDFPENSVIAQKVNKTKQPLVSEKPGDENPVSDWAATINNEISRVFSVYEKSGEVWGVDMSPNYSGSPIVLRDLRMVDNHTITGKLHHPYQVLINDFTLMDDHGQISLQIKAAAPSSKGVRRATLLCDAEGDELVVRNGPRFALSAENNTLIQKGFEKNLEPWKFSGDISGYFYLLGKLFSFDTLEEASSSWVESGRAIRVKNLPSRFVSSNLVYLLSTRPYGTFPAKDAKTAEPKGRIPIQPIPNSKNPTWVSYDMDEYATLRDGDIWRGKIDWPGHSIKQESNITNIGILNNLEPITWYGNDFYFFNKTATDKPILRINVSTGKIDELGPIEAIQRHSYGSPDGRFVFYSDGRGKYKGSGVESLVHVYDCKKRQSFTMDATIDERFYSGALKKEPVVRKIEPRAWLSKSLFITEIGWYDLEKRKRNLFIEAQGIIRERPEHFYRVVSFNFLPLLQFADITVTSYPGKGMEIQRRYRVDRNTNTAVELPMEFDRNQNNHANITWIDENRYVFSRSMGGLSDVGTWLYDLRTKKHRKLTSLYQNGPVTAENYCTSTDQSGLWHTPVFSNNQHLVFPDKERIVFSSMKGKSSVLLSVPLSKGNIVEVPLKNGYDSMKRILPAAIGLPEKDNSRTVDSVLPDASKPFAAEAQTGHKKTTQIVNADKPVTEGATEAHKKEAESVYEWCVGNKDAATSIDCECLADQFLDFRAKNGSDLEKDSLVIRITQNGCRNVIRTSRLEYETCMKGSGFSYNGIPPGDYCDCYAKEWANLLKAYEGKLDEYKKSSMRLKARNHCQRASAYGSDN